MDPLEDVDWPRTTWIVFGLVLSLVLGYVFWTFVGTFVFALFVYYAIRPFHRRIRNHIDQRTVAATLSLLVFAVPVVVLIAYTSAIALQEVGRFSASADLGPYADVLGPYVNVSAAVENPRSLLESPGGWETIQDTLDTVLDYLGLVMTSVIHTFLLLAVAFYLLRDGHRLRRFVTTLGNDHDVLDTYLRAVDRSLSKIFFGNLLNAVITAAIGAISFGLYNVVAPAPLQVPYPALMGVLAGVASLIPIVGMKLVWIPLAGYLAFRAYMTGGGWGFVAGFSVLSIVVVDAIPDFALRPYVSGRSLHVGSVMIAYIVGPLLFGWPGIFLGPMLLVVIIQFVRIVLPELLAGEAIQPYSLDPGAIVDDGPEATGDPPTPGDAGEDEQAQRPDPPPSGSGQGSQSGSGDG